MSESPSPRRRVVTLLLLSLCCGLSVAIYLGARAPMTGASVAAPASPPQPASASESDPVFAMPPLSAYADVLTRPLFSETRRRPAVSTARDDKPADFTLVGIVISPTERHALLSHGTPAQLEHVVEGQSVDGWTVTAIEPSRVVLAQGGRETEIGSGKKPQEPVKPEPVAPPHYAIGTEPIANGGD
jgi:general secretion pathway protein N